MTGRVIRDHGVGVEVPPPGQVAYAIGDGTNGHEELGVETDKDGNVRLLSVGSEIQLLVQPSNDDFGQAIAVAQLPHQGSVSTLDASMEPDEPHPGCADVGSTVWYRFTPTEDVFLEASTEGSDFDTVLGVYVGSTLSGLTEVACDDDGGSASDSSVSFDASDGITYHIQAGGYDGDAGHLAFALAAADTLPPPPPDSLEPCPNCIPACKDRAFKHYPGKPHLPRRGHKWFFNAGSTPRNLTQREATSAILAATRTIERSRNDCGLNDRVALKTVYKGKTNRPASISSGGACRSDGRNIVDFGRLSFSVGFACFWSYRGGVIIEADIRFNKTTQWTTDPLSSDCVGAIDLQSVAAHERGHTAGLDHTYGARHQNLLMYPSMPRCNLGLRTLGLGDVRGLRGLY